MPWLLVIVGLLLLFWWFGRLEQEIKREGERLNKLAAEAEAERKAIEAASAEAPRENLRDVTPR